MGSQESQKPGQVAGFKSCEADMIEMSLAK
jgi:hypothetical protein